MGDLFKNDPILKTVLVIFLGLVAFSFLFGFNFGGTGLDASMSQANQHAGHHGGMGGNTMGGISYISIIMSGLIQTLIQILMFLLVVALLAGGVMGIKRFIEKQDKEIIKESPVIKYINQDPVLKIIVIAIAGIFGLYLLSGLLNGIGFGYGVSPQFMLLGLISFLMKIAMFAFVIFGSIALWRYFKNQATVQESKRDIIQVETTVTNPTTENNNSEKNI